MSGNHWITFVINLDGSDSRLQNVTEQLVKKNIDFVRVPAVDGRNRPPTSFDAYDEQGAIKFYGRPMTGGEIGCYLSHLKCAKALLDSDAKYAIVLEDDMTFTQCGSAEFSELIDQLERCAPGFEIANLGRTAKRFYTRVGNFSNSHIQHAHYFPVTTTGLIWSRKGAAAFWNTRHEIFAPVDHFFRCFFSRRGTGYAMSPEIVIPNGSDSEIDAIPNQNGKARKRIPRTPKYFAREFSRQSTNYVNASRHLVSARLKRNQMPRSLQRKLP